MSLSYQYFCACVKSFCSNEKVCSRKALLKELATCFADFNRQYSTYHVTYPIMHLMLPVCCLHTNWVSTPVQLLIYSVTQVHVGIHPPPPWTEWQTGAKILPCPKLRLRAVIIVKNTANNEDAFQENCKTKHYLRLQYYQNYVLNEALSYFLKDFRNYTHIIPNNAVAVWEETE